MTFNSQLKLGLGLLMLAGLPATASAQDAALYAYPTENFCPAGLQPITISGVICCGVPTRAQSYAQMMQHPVQRKVQKVRRVQREYIPTQKGIPTGKGLGD
ncbi:hypothetical protein [Oceaniglobus ichthyenteri]|uniref:hypothetical protein n=1 Tax=Oceaniglobus ichthyenteri TaxID=2136177 RepID=UPI00198022C3|nr:hypothetical protein [Oceaniglobus ichthyenteri]